MSAARPTGRTLLVCHISAADSAAAALEASLGADGACDFLVYGQGAESFPAPARGRLVTPPTLARSTQGARAALRWWREIWGQYTRIVIAQPDLEISRARGVFLALPTLLGGDQGLAIDPAGTTPAQPISRARGLADLARWTAAQVGAALIAATATLVMVTATRRSAPSVRRAPRGGQALYLRTDVDIAVRGLRAGGSAAHTEGIVRALQKAGYETAVYSTGEIAGVPEARKLPAALRANTPTEIVELASVWPQVVALFKGPRPAFIYQRYSLNNLTGLILSRLWRVPLILEVNASEVYWRRQWSRLHFGRLAAATERLMLTRADTIAVVSENAAQEVLAMGADPSRLRIVPNGVLVDRFAGAPARPTPFDDDAFVVCFCGLFYPWHGVPVLARAFVELAARSPRARLLLIGDGGERARVEAILAEAGLRDRAELTGLVPRDAVPGYMQAADVLVSPHADVPGFIGSPIKIFEYMAAGRAIVATAVAQIATVLEDERTALIVPPGRPDAMAQALLRLERDPELRESLGRAAGREAALQHSWDARLAETLGDKS